MFAGPPWEYRRRTKIGLPPRPPEHVPGCPGPFATLCCPFQAKAGGSPYDFFGRDYFFPVHAYRRFIWVLAQASTFLVLLRSS